MEEVDTITVAVSGIDINKVEPLDTRRLVTFINHYLATTVSFLNHFASNCEQKLDRMQQQLHRVECRLKLLECKLSSIPGIPSTPTVEGQSAPTSSSAPVPGPSSGSNNASSSSTNSNNIPESSSSSSSNSNSTTTTTHMTTITTTEKQPNGDEGYDDSEDQQDGKTAGTMTSAPSSNKDDPRYAKYFKMVTVGVPVQAVKQKMMSEGIDPSVLDN